MIDLFGRKCLLILFTIMMFTVSCTNDDSVGGAVRPEGDNIVVAADTFHIKSENVFNNVMSAQADSMYMGEFYSPVFGTTKAELLVQFAPPEKYEFPDDSRKPTADSLVLMMYYKSWYGARNIPLEISVYEMNSGAIDYNKQYLSNLETSDFTDLSLLMGKRMVTSVDLSESDSIRESEGYVPTIRYKFDDEQLERFYNIARSPFGTTEEFLDHFKGIFITSRYGASTVFNFFEMHMKLHYHYTYEKNGKDTIVNTSIIYPANKEVRQLNKFSHNDIQEVVEENDSINFIKASAGIYTKLEIPMDRIRERIKSKIGNKELHVNGAAIQLEIADMEENLLDLSYPFALMAITESEYEDFLKNYDVPTVVDTNTVIGYYTSAINAYNIDISYYLVKHLRNNPTDENLSLLLLPVQLQQVVNSNTGEVNITRIRPQAEVGGVRLRSGNNANSPMKIKLLYAGF